MIHRGRGRIRHVLLALALVMVACSADPPTAPAPQPDGPTATATRDTAPSDSAAPSTTRSDAPSPDAPAEPDATSPRPAGDRDGEDAGPPGVDGIEASPPPPEPPASRAALARWLAPLVTAAADAAGEGTIAVLVTDEYGREVAAHAPDTPVMPASTLKLVTAAAVLTTLGPDGRLATHLEATAPIGPTGALDGDLLLRGVGDPTIVTDEYRRWIYPSRPHSLLDDLADQLVAQGLTTVAGDVVAVTEGFVGDGRAEGWQDNYFHDLDARYVTGLTVDAGLQTLITYPEPQDDAEDGAQDDAEDGAVAGSDAPADPTPPGPPDVRVQLAPDPAVHTVTELVRLLEERGVQVRGEPRLGPVDEPIVGRLGTLRSPPMRDVLRFAVQRSDNHLTDQLLWVVGRLRTGSGSWDHGERALTQVLDHLGVTHDGVRFADGSGLSRDDRVTPRLLVELDRTMLAGRHAEVWASLMAVTGESGTLRNRLGGTVASGRFLGKTGTLRDVTALSGAVVDAAGARYHLAVVANADGGGRWAARVLMDEVILALVADVDGCAIAPADEVDPTPLGVPPSLVTCP